MLKHLLKSLANSLGADIVKFPPLSGTARQLRDFLKTNDINLIIDVGACDGDYCRMLRGPVGYKGRIVSFEPTRSTFADLQASMRSDPLWRGFNVGLSDNDGEATFNTYGDRRDFNSLLNLNPDEAETFGVDMSKKATEKITLRSLSSLWGEITRDTPDPRVYLKTDTQGHDKAVISGAGDRIKSIVGLQSEMAAVQIYEGMTPMSEMLAYLGRLNYVPIGFHPLTTAPAYGGAAAEFDVIFRRA